MLSRPVILLENLDEAEAVRAGAMKAEGAAVLGGGQGRGGRGIRGQPPCTKFVHWSSSMLSMNSSVSPQIEHPQVTKSRLRKELFSSNPQNPLCSFLSLPSP